MKNLLKSISLLIILSVILISCKTASVMKRHYNKGYYVSKYHKPSDTKLIPNINQDSERAPIASKPVKSIPDISQPELKDDLNTKDKVTAGIIKDNKKTKREQATYDFDNPFNERPSIFSGLISKPQALSNGELAKDDVARDALSLIWILIVVLLIVYIIGLIFDLFGLGPIFHLLGVIILVLLVLWLLRII